MKIVLFANTDWYLYNFRRSLALELKSSGFDVLLVSPPGPYAERLTSLGFRWKPLWLRRRSLNPFREATVLWSLIRLLQEERPILVHGFTLKCAVYAALAGRCVGVPARVSAVTGLGYVFSSNDLRARVLRPVVRGILRGTLNSNRAIVVLQNADDVQMFTHHRLVDPKRIRLIRGSGVDCRRFAPRQSSIGASGTLRVLLAGRLLWDKGVREFVDAARLLLQQGKAIEFVLAGRPDIGNPASVTESVVRSWENEKLITWMGHVDDMAGLLNSVHVVVAPSYREGLPKTVVEAAACGRPIITTDVPGCREVISNGVDGLVVPPRDAGALARAINQLDQDRELCRRFGAAARKRVLAEFDETIVIEQTIKAYTDLISSQALPPQCAGRGTRRATTLGQGSGA